MTWIQLSQSFAGSFPKARRTNAFISPENEIEP
jgi:hypothetical protein